MGFLFSPALAPSIAQFRGFPSYKSNRVNWLQGSPKLFWECGAVTLPGYHGHTTASCFFQVNGFRITDPVFGSRIGIPVGGVSVGMKRLLAPALRIPELPAIHLILLSRAHMDHFDLG